ncbi:DNA-deoxyinosine glycosylase [Thiomicrospira sp. R3]|uniref:DNA-deoxyinosine glycosylase n=1 Tax=Thiomicrospira sp. R3 TaxID=3035472 RepID=UPI00259BA87C|nr:DNA-deoxyinosine glycosylase [Thiomicrospira sp. R3]WFE68277.1 DNA-deoxyinosine glycosylase [Thiomicrospira sp. R3]
MVCQGFNPIEPAEMRVLILGSMPGVASLEQQAYYAHPRNAFWPVMERVCNQAWSLDTSQRYQQLMAHHIGLWDVLAQCQRQGSLDTAIQLEGLRVNNIGCLIERHPECRVVVFNGSKAAQLFKRYVLKQNEILFQNRVMFDLPSTSPANARLNLVDKTKIWQDKLGYFL